MRQETGAIQQGRTINKGTYGIEGFRYLDLTSWYSQIAEIAKQAGVYLRQYSATRVSFENGVFGRKVSGIETIVWNEFIPLSTPVSQMPAKSKA